MLAWAVVVVAVASAATQAYVLIARVHDGVGRRHRDPIHDLVIEIDRRMPPNATFSNTPYQQLEFRYGLYPRHQRHVELYGSEADVRARLHAVGSRYVIIVKPVPPAFAATATSWYHQIYANSAGRLVEIDQ